MKLLGVAVAVVAGVLGCGSPAPKPLPPEYDEEAVPTERAGPQVDVATKGLVLPEVRFAAGERFTEVNQISMRSRVSLGAESIRFDRNADQEIRHEVLEVAGGRITRERVTFVIDDVRSILGRETQRDPAPHAGKTYVVTHTATPPAVTDERGRTPPAAEVAAVRARLASGISDALDRIFAGRRWRFDERIALSPAALATLDDDATRSTAFTMELRDASADVATFWVTWSFVRSTGNGPVRMELAGPRDIAIATGRILTMSLRGTITADLGAPISGEATLTARVE